MESQYPSPVSQLERSHILDVLRGFALLGILIINTIRFSGYDFFTVEMKEEISTYPIDKYLSALQTVFAEGKFYSIFSLLFGIGFSIIFLRLREKGLKVYSIFYRRLLYLLLFGFIHIYFLWEGDILILYALLGMLLPLFVNCSNRTLLIWSLALILAPILIDVAKFTFDFKTGAWLENFAMSIDEITGIPLDDGFRRYLYREGSGWQEFWNWNQSGPFYRFSGIIESNRIPKVLGMFILGFYVGRNKLYQNLEYHVTLFKRVFIWGIIIGIPASLVMVYSKWGENWSTSVDLLHTISYSFGVVPLALAYATGLCLYWIKTRGKNRLMIFAPVGRMALTNYILQTIICLALFYEIGLGLGGYIGPIVFIPIVFVIYAVQVIVSKIWLNYFTYGPLEWIWRILTYQKHIPLRKTER